MTGTAPAAEPPRAAEAQAPRRPLLTRRTAVLAALASGLLVLVAAGRTWVGVSGLEGHTATAAATGSDAAPVVAAMAVVALAGALALTTVRRLSGLAVGLLLVAAGATVAAAATGVALDPTAAAERAASAVTATTAPAAAHAVTAWPWVCAAGGVLTALTGAGVLASAGRWGAGRRYEAGGGAALTQAEARRRRHVDEMDAWDALSRGNDPT